MLNHFTRMPQLIIAAAVARLRFLVVVVVGYLTTLPRRQNTGLPHALFRAGIRPRRCQTRIKAQGRDEFDRSRNPREDPGTPRSGRY